MPTDNLFFISHSSKDNALALQLYNILLEINPEWKERIFLDCSDEKPLEKHSEWRERMYRELEKSKHLIFVTSDIEHVKEGNGYLFEEVSFFYSLKANRHKINRGQYNISYFGIFLCGCDFENMLFNDSEHGSDYRKLYQSPEHLVLTAHETLDGARERIKNKVNMLFSKGENEENTALLLDKTRSFAFERQKNNSMFSEAAIENTLIPLMVENEREIDFTSFINTVKNSHVALIGNEGGCGKTTALTKLYYSFLNSADTSVEDSMIPLYVDAKSLGGENHLILRYLAKNLFNEHTAITDRNTSNNVGIIDSEFCKERITPRYLLIIDGYNEIPSGILQTFESELIEFLPDGRYSNVRVVISGRHLGNNLPDSVFNTLTVSLLKSNAVTSYLWQKGVLNGRLPESLFSILKIPMYLKMYVDTHSDNRISNKAELLCTYVDWQQEKDSKALMSDEKKALYHIMLKHVLPVIAHGMLMKDLGGSSFVLDQDNLEVILADASEILNDVSYKKYYGREYREQLRASKFTEYDELDLSDLAIEYFVDTCKMFHQDKDGNLDFVHQIYRDFFCAYLIAEAIKRNGENGDCSSFSQRILDSDVTEFVVELLTEKKPFFDTEKECWDYSCNQSSYLLSTLDKIRGGSGKAHAVSVANITAMLRYARKNDLSGLDLSGLDFTMADLRTCLFCRFDKENQYPTSFAGSKLDAKNIFTENHFDEIIAACSNEHCIACIDSTGVIKFWNKCRYVDFPTKIITGVLYSVSKMLFSPENDRIYAMTSHEILEIEVPTEFSSVAKVKTVFKTAKRLRDIVIKRGGEIYFSTNLNSFNYKSIHNPDAPDEYDFYGINSGACIVRDKKRLAFGHITGYEGLRIYDYCEGEQNWKERKFGYAVILEKFITELEEFFKGINLYWVFPTNNEWYDERRTYFVYKQQQFEDCTHDHNRIPRLIASYVLNELKESNKTLYPNQQRKFDAIIEKYETILLEELKPNGLLMSISGRRITSISAKPGTDTILISCVVDYKEMFKGQKNNNKSNKSKQYENIVLELDTETFKTHFITKCISDHIFKASYMGDDIILVSDRHVSLYDKNGIDYAHVTTLPKPIRNFIPLEDKNTFLMLSNHFIYEIDKSLRCVKSFENIFDNTPNITYHRSANGDEYLVKGTSLKNAEPDTAVTAISLKDGRTVEVMAGEYETLGYTDGTVLGDKGFKICSKRLVAFENGIKTDITEVPYKLFVCGCDFTGVTGSVSEVRYIQMLNRMGAITDTVERFEITVSASDEGFIPSDIPFIPTEELERAYVAYSQFPDMTFEEDCHFSDAEGGNQQYQQKTWDLIHKASYSKHGLEETDYLILEWVWRLNYVEASMIAALVDAGIIVKPNNYSDAQKRMRDSLHKTFKFIFRSQFCQNGVGKRIPIYTVCFPYGARLLNYITGEKVKNLLLIPHNNNISKTKTPGRNAKYIRIDNARRIKEIRKTLALNKWFTLTVKRHADLVRDYSLSTVFDTEDNFSGRANVQGYIQLSDRPFFAQAFRYTDVSVLDNEIVDKVNRLCILALYYRSMTRKGKQLDKLTRQPIVILIGENYEQCKLLNEQVGSIYPNVRRLFTFDTLLNSEEYFNTSGNYFEFVDSAPYSVRLEDII